MSLANRLAASVLLSLLFSSPLYAQNRDVRAERIYIDDNGSEGVTLLVPHPMQSGASYSLTLPDSLPSTNFVLLGNPSGFISAEEPSMAFNTISWLLSGNSVSNPANDFLGTTDSIDLAFRTNNVERLRVNALGDIGIGTSSPTSARLHLKRTFDDSIPDDPMFGLPLAFGIRSEMTSPAVVDSSAAYVSSGSLTLLQGSNDMSNAGSFIGAVGLTLNNNTGGTIREITGLLGLALQVDPAASTDQLRGMDAQAQISAGTVNEGYGVIGGLEVGSSTVTTASSLYTRLSVSNTGTVNNGYGLYVSRPQVDVGGTLTNFTGVEIENLTDSGQLAIRYNGSGTNAPFVVQADGDVGVGTSSADYIRLHVAKTFEDAVPTDTNFGTPLSFGLRTDVTSPSVATPGAVYVGSGTLSSITGTTDYSGINQFIGSAAQILNSNTGGTVNSMIGIVGQLVQTDPGAAIGTMGGIQGTIQVGAGTASDAYGISAGVGVGNGTLTNAYALTTNIEVAGNGSIAQGYGLMIEAPFVNAGGTLTNYTGINIENLSDSGQNVLRYDASGSNAPVIIEGDGDVGIGTLSPGEARLRVAKTFPDSVSVDLLFNERLSFGIRTDVTNPGVADSGGVYVGNASLAFVEGGNDMSEAESFVGMAGLSVNSNTGGTVAGMLGIVGQSLQLDPASSSQHLIGIQGSAQVSGGTVTDALGVSGEVQMDGGSADNIVGLVSRLDLSGTAAATNGFGLIVSGPEISGGATLSNYIGIEIGDIPVGSKAVNYVGSGPNTSFVLEEDGDVGIGDNTPDAKLDVENNDALLPTLALNNTASDGIALQVENGGVVLSYGSGAPSTIPVDVAVFDVNDGSGGSTPSVGIPTSGSNGQILYVYISDPDGATVGGNGYAAGDRVTYIYVAGAWQLFHVN